MTDSLLQSMQKSCSTITFCMIFTTGITAIRKLLGQLISKKYTHT